MPIRTVTELALPQSGGQLAVLAWLTWQGGLGAKKCRPYQVW